MDRTTRRQFLAAGATGIFGSLTGCINVDEPSFLETTPTQTFESPYKWRASSSPEHTIIATTRPADGTIFFGDSDLHAVDTSNGNTRWQHDGWGPPVLSDDTVYTLDRSGENGVVALAADTGERQWKSPHGDSILVKPVVANQTVLYPDGEGTLFALGTADGQRQWEFQTVDEIQGIAASDGTVVIGDSDGNVQAIDIASGERRWNSPIKQPVSGGPHISGGTVYSGGETGALVAVDLQSGQVQWDQPVKNAVTGVREHGETLFVTEVNTGDGSLHALDAATGEERYRFTDLYAWVAPTVDDQAVYVGTQYSDDPPHLFAFDPGSREVLAQLELDGEVEYPPIVADETIYVTTGVGLEAIVKNEFLSNG